jgi:hypothetical protein
VAGYLGLSWEEGRRPGRGRDASRGDLIRYEAAVEPAVRVGIGAGAVLLETGYSGGHEPSEMVDIVPIMCEPLAIDPAGHEDTQFFRLRALEPRRTLIEKLFALHHIATLWHEGDVREEERFGRHYYDVFKLLDHRPTVDKLRADRDGFAELVAEVERLSRIHFGGTSARPEAGFAASPAFTPEHGSEFRVWLEGKFEEALALLPRAVSPPTFGSVLQRVEAHGDLL